MSRSLPQPWPSWRRLRSHRRPSGGVFPAADSHVAKPAAYVDQLLIEGKGGMHHIWGRDHYKTTLNAFEFKRTIRAAPIW